MFTCVSTQRHVSESYQHEQSIFNRFWQSQGRMEEQLLFVNTDVFLQNFWAANDSLTW